MDDRSSEIEIELGAEKAREEPSERKVGRQARSDASRSSRSRSDRLGRTHAGNDAEQLADELGRTRLRTTDDGYVEACVTALERVSAETVRLVVSLPTGESVAFRLEKPVPWSEEFLLARLVRDAGYDAATIDHLVGERVYLARGDPIEEDGVWAEGTGTVPDTYRGVAAAIGLGDFVDTRPCGTNHRQRRRASPVASATAARHHRWLRWYPACACCAFGHDGHWGWRDGCALGTAVRGLRRCRLNTVRPCVAVRMIADIPGGRYAYLPSAVTVVQ